MVPLIQEAQLGQRPASSCLLEVEDQSVHEEVQDFLQTENRSEKELIDLQCSALAYMLQMSEEVEADSSCEEPQKCHVSPRHESVNQ